MASSVAQWIRRLEMLPIPGFKSHSWQKIFFLKKVFTGPSRACQMFLGTPAFQLRGLQQSSHRDCKCGIVVVKQQFHAWTTTENHGHGRKWNRHQNWMSVTPEGPELCMSVNRFKRPRICGHRTDASRMHKTARKWNRNGTDDPRTSTCLLEKHNQKMSSFLWWLFV